MLYSYTELSSTLGKALCNLTDMLSIYQSKSCQQQQKPVTAKQTLDFDVKNKASMIGAIKYSVVNYESKNDLHLKLVDTNEDYNTNNR